MSAAEARPHKHRHHRQHHHARVVQSQQPVQEQWLFGGFQSGNVPLPLILPGRVLPGNGEVRDIFPHLDEPQLD